MFRNVEIFAFVIMRDHIHIVWRIRKDESIDEIIKAFKKYVGYRIIKLLNTKNYDYLSENFSSIRTDRRFKFWKLQSKSLQLVHYEIIEQKVNYIHNNPIRGSYKTCKYAWEHPYSSAKFYKNKDNKFEFLTNWKSVIK